MKWVTRKDANVDRIACPRLIKKFVDPDGGFLYLHMYCALYEWCQNEVAGS